MTMAASAMVMRAHGEQSRNCMQTDAYSRPGGMTTNSPDRLNGSSRASFLPDVQMLYLIPAHQAVGQYQ